MKQYFLLLYGRMDGTINSCKLIQVFVTVKLALYELPGCCILYFFFFVWIPSIAAALPGVHTQQNNIQDKTNNTC